MNDQTDSDRKESVPTKDTDILLDPEMYYLMIWAN